MKPPETIDLKEKQFLHFVNTEEEKGNGPIERVVTRIVRSRERNYSAPGNKVEFKEYIWYYENWFGKNWINETVAPVTDHVEGMYMEQDVTARRDRDWRTGQLLAVQTKRTGEHPVYTIPFSKEKVREIVGDRDPSTIVFTIKFPGSVSGGHGVRNNFSYNDFVNLSLEDAFKLNSKIGGPVMNPLSASNSLSFQPG